MTVHFDRKGNAITGKVLTGNIGAEGRKMDYRIIGDPVNTAARIEALTRQYKDRILMTEFTAVHVRSLIGGGKMGQVELVDHGFAKVKGKDREMQIFELKELPA